VNHYILRLNLSLATIILTCTSQLAYSKANGSHINMGISYPSLNLKISDQGQETASGSSKHSIVYEPVVAKAGHLSYTAGYLSLSYSRSIDEEEEKPQFSGGSIKWYRSTYGFDIDHQQFESFQITNGSGFSLALPNSEINKQDLRVNLTTARVYILPFRKQYAFSVSFEPAVKKKTGVAAGVMFSGNDLTFSTNQGLIPQTWKIPFGNNAGFVDANLRGNYLQLCAAFTLAYGPSYFSFLGAVGPGEQSYNYTVNTFSENTNTGTNRSQAFLLKTQAGLVGQTFFTAISTSIKSPEYTLDKLTIAGNQQETKGITGFKWAW